MYHERKNGVKKNRQRKNVIFFHPPFCTSVETNIGKVFLRLVKKHFHASSHYRKILNKNTIKLSYSCMGNMKSVINSHNRKVLQNLDSGEMTERTCNCRKKNECPLNGNCLAKNLVYKATVYVSNGEEQDYIGSTGNFKIRYGQHKSSFTSSIEKIRKSTELSKFIWSLKRKNENIKDKKKKIDYTISWNIIHQTRTIRGPNGCNLCNLERLEIANARNERTLNKRNELQTRCPHEKGRFFENRSGKKEKKIDLVRTNSS